jgi:uracil-DNA glycosylase family 4
MSDERKEAADIARSLRRYVERERASGGAELLADGATKMRREQERSGTRATGGAEALRGESKPAGSQGPAEAGFASARAGRMPASSGREVPPLLPSPAASAGAPPATNLFGEPEPQAAPKKRAAQLLDEPLPYMFAEGLSPGGLEARAALASASLPVLATIADEVRACTKCGLCDTRTQAVPGVGTARSGIVFVGEAPGAEEDRLGEPFVGRAGQLLDRIIKAMDDARMIPGLPLNRETVYICNVLKCRPPENRNPLPHEIERCSPYLRRQLETIQPRVICCLGKFAAELLVGAKGTIAGLRGKVYRYQGAKLIVTYHPAACLRNPDYKRPVWEDMQLLAREYLSD